MLSRHGMDATAKAILGWWLFSIIYRRFAPAQKNQKGSGPLVTLLNILKLDDIQGIFVLIKSLTISLYAVWGQ